MGILPIDHDTSQPCVQIPTDTYISDLDSDKIHFLRTVPNVMKKLNAKIDWEHNSETELHIYCTLGKSETDAAKDWENDVKESILFFFSTIKVERRECLSNTWESVCAQVRKIRNTNQTVAIIEKASEFTLCMAGRPETVKHVHQQVDELCKQIEQNAEYIKYSIKMNDLEKALLQKVNFIHELKKKYPKVKISLKEIEMVLHGPATDLLAIQGEFNSFTRNTQKRGLNLTKGQLKVLAMLQKETNGQFNNSLNGLQVVLTVEGDNSVTFGKDRLMIKGDTVALFGMEKDVDKCEELLTSIIMETYVKISKEEQSAFVGNTWHLFSSTLVIRYGGALHLEYVKSKASVIIAAQATDINGVLEDVKKFIQQNTMKKTLMKIDVAQTRMITQWMKEDLKKVEKDFERYHIKIFAQDVCGLTITGTEDGFGSGQNQN